jgi:hypothetical protein
MELFIKPYDHLIIIDDSTKNLVCLKQTLKSIGYASHISCFENPKIAYHYVRNCKKLPEVIFMNMMKIRDMEFIGSFINKFNHLTRFIMVTSSSKNIIDMAISAISPSSMQLLLKFDKRRI